MPAAKDMLFLAGKMLQPLGRLFSKWNIDLDRGPLAQHGIDIQQAVDELGALAQVDHPQATAPVVGRVDRLHVKAQAVVFDLEQGHITLKGLEAHPDVAGARMLAGVVDGLLDNIEDDALLAKL